MSLQVPPERSVEITSYCCDLRHMPLSAAVVGFGLDADKHRAMQLQNYLQSDHVGHVMPALAAETRVLKWLTTVATPPIPLPSLWKAMAVKCLIGWVKRGMSLIDVETDPNQTKYLILAGWTKEQAEMVSQDDYGPPSPLVVQPATVQDPFDSEGEDCTVEDVMYGFHVPNYCRDCQIPKRVLPRDRAGQPSGVSSDSS
ncbi:hypothetical protein DL546_003804 [Coniochaeta pulveracea]|uniref:Uncharacterized protein n=1 Tax=Coniochaeta pulveracea TaxID=177199 RepID=A0A420XZ74_9PEZI|nr:hypothetical protein DL546_003804 [Coniochaeta pulveracea]